MGVKLGTLDISSFKVGSADCKVYLGETLLYSGDTPTPPPLSGCSIVVDEISGYTGTAFNDTGDCPIYVPAESVDTYKAESGWSNVASRIQAIQ